MQWYYADSGSELGPVPEPEFQAMVRDGIIGPETLVWTTESPQRLPYREHAPNAFAESGAVAPPDAADLLFCTECGRPTPHDELVRFGEHWVCGNCKGVFAQRLREGAVSTHALIYAGFWRRFCALMIDGIITNVAILPLFYVTGIFDRPDDVLLTLMSLPISILLAGAYEVLFLHRFRATPGKMLLGVQVVTASGASLTVGRAAGRYAARYLSAFTLSIGYLIAAFDSQKRALHDHIAGTRAVRARA